MGKTAFDAQRGNLFLFDAKDLELITDKGHPLYDNRVTMPLDERLVRNIMVHGVIEPVVISKIGDRAVVVDGRQRVRAAIEASRRLAEDGHDPVRVPCVVRRGEDASLFAVMVSSNEARQADTPLNRARKAQRMLDLGASDEQVETAFGIGSQTLKNWKALLETPAAVRKAVDAGRISCAAALEISKLPADQIEAAVERAGEPSKSSKRVGKSARAVGEREGTRAPKVRSRKEIEARLSEKRLPADYAKALRWVLRMDE